MNERIKKLAKQAGFFPELNYEHTGWHAAGHNDLFEKFAELIVRECVEVLRMVPYDCDGPEFGDEVVYQEAVKKHFGVEE